MKTEYRIVPDSWFIFVFLLVVSAINIIFKNMEGAFIDLLCIILFGGVKIEAEKKKR